MFVLSNSVFLEAALEGAYRVGDVSLTRAVLADGENAVFSTLQYFWDNGKLGFPFIALDHFYKDTIVVWITHQNRVPSYNTFGLRIGATFAKGLNLTLAVRNLTDTRAWMHQNPSVPYEFLPGFMPVSGWMTQPRAASPTKSLSGTLSTKPGFQTRWPGCSTRAATTGSGFISFGSF